MKKKARGPTGSSLPSRAFDHDSLAVQGAPVLDQQSFPSAPVRDYRRGIEDKDGKRQWQKLWHFNVKCKDYPTRNFAIRKDRPSDDELCSQCDRAAGT